MVFPDPRVELEIGGVWTDVTADALREGGGIRYRWGRRAEGSRADPATMALSLFNPDGKYASRNPNSPYFGLLGRNTPVRVSHGGADVALVVPSGVRARASTPDHASLDITGDIDLRIELTPSSWSSVTRAGGWELAGKYVAGGQQSWLWDMADGGLPQFFWSVDGTAVLSSTSSAQVPTAPGVRGALRVTLDVNNGAGGWTCTHYTGPTIAGPWTQVSQQVTTSGTTSIFNSTAPLDVGDVNTVGFTNTSRLVHAFEMRSGIAGSVVADPDFSAQASGTTSFADDAGRTWTAGNGGEITSRRIRAVPEASAWTPQWGAGGQDVTTPVEAAGILRRLGQGSKSLASTLRRRLPTRGPVAYWPLEDGRTATQASSPLPGVPPLATIGLAYAQDDTCPGSSALPVVSATASMRGSVPTYTSPTNGYLVACLYSLDAVPASQSAWLRFTTTGTAASITCYWTSTDFVVDLHNSAGTLITAQLVANTGLFGTDRWFRFDFGAQANGGNTDIHLGFVDIDGAGSQFNFSIAGSPGRVTGITTLFGTLMEGLALGHLAVFPSSDTSVWGEADNGYRGETGAARLVRLGAEESVPISAAVGPGSATAMGPQRLGTLMSLVGECEDADGGILYEDREQPGLLYRSRTSLYNQTPRLTVSYGQLITPLTPVDDDRYLSNDRTVERVGGSSARAVLTSGPLSVAAPPNGVGTYDDSRSLNLATDAQCADIAYWLLHRGTWDESRYPQVRLYLHKHPELVPEVAALQPGDIIRITDLPAFLPPGPLDLLVEGAEEEIRSLEWKITLTCSPAGPWTVAVADDPDSGRADTDGTVLGASVDADDTVLLLTTPVGPLWTTDLLETPFDVTVGGEVMTVTMINGSRQDRFQRTVVSGWGTADSGQAWTTTGGSASDYSVQGA